MRFQDSGKNKAVTFSYDDGVTQDIRLIELFNRYGLKCTFNINSELLGTGGMLCRRDMRIAHYKVYPQDIRTIYENHEVAAHTLRHPNLTQIEDDAEVIRQVEEDRLKLSELAGYEVVGMAYPCGGVNNDDRVAKLIRENTGIRYARTITCTHDFEPQENLHRFNPTVYHIEDFDALMAMGEKFADMKCDKPQIFYIWGHSYEMDYQPDYWVRMEEFCEMISGREDIFYGTNKEVLL